MTRTLPGMHGRTHLPDGSDPIGFDDSAGDFIFPPVQESDLFGHPFNLEGRIYNVWIDYTLGIPGGCYLNNYRHNAFGLGVETRVPTTPVATFGDEICLRFALGPTGSEWGINIGYMSGPAYGILDLQLASVPDTATAGFLTLYDDLNWISQPGGWIDAYFTGGTKSDGSGPIVYPRPDYLSEPWKFRLTGDPGDPMTAWSGSNVDGGPGIYAIKLRVRGKNASSSGYKVGLWKLSFNRGSDLTNQEQS